MNNDRPAKRKTIEELNVLMETINSQISKTQQWIDQHPTHEKALTNLAKLCAARDVLGKAIHIRQSNQRFRRETIEIEQKLIQRHIDLKRRRAATRSANWLQS